MTGPRGMPLRQVVAVLTVLAEMADTLDAEVHVTLDLTGADTTQDARRVLDGANWCPVDIHLVDEDAGQWVLVNCRRWPVATDDPTTEVDVERT